MRYLGIKIHGGYTSESGPVAELLGGRGDAYDALVIYHEWPGDFESSNRYEVVSRARLARIDTGLRPNVDGRRNAGSKVASLVRFRASFHAMVRIARQYQPDVVHSSQQLWDCAAATHVARRLRVPHVMHLNYPIGPWLRTGFSASPRATALLSSSLGLANPLARLKQCEHVVTISEFLRGEAIRFGVPPERVTTVRDTMRPFPEPEPGTREAVRAELGMPHDASLVGIVGRHDPDKGQGDTIDAFVRATSKRPSAWLAIVGDGPVRAQLEAHARESGCGERIVFTGYRRDVPRLLAPMDIFMHPSRREGFGLAIAEAAAAGLPVIGYAEGGAREIVVDGRTGLLAPPGDVDGLSERLSRLLDDPELARRMGAAGRARIAEEFRPEDSARAFADLLCRIAADGCRLAGGQDGMDRKGVPSATGE